MSKTHKCSQCGCIITEAESCTFDGKLLCQSCFDDQTVVCDNCGTRIWVEESCGDGLNLCDECFSENYSHCHTCGRLIHESETRYDSWDNPYCRSCFHAAGSNICDYDHKPEPIFYGADIPCPGMAAPLYLGVELEVDKGGEYDENAGDLLNLANTKKERLYIKHDGSLEDGFELVSHPMTLAYHQQKMPWKKLLESAVSMGYRSHQTTTCGLHVHISRSALGSSAGQIDQTVGRLVYFVEAHWKELLRFSRRSEEALRRWAARYGLKDTARQTYDVAKQQNRNRYACVNLQNTDTVELRIFRGTLRYETFLAVLQLVEEICRLAVSMDDTAFEAMTWSAFAAGIGSEKKELIAYLKQKRLYINEPVAEAEEV